MHIIIWSENINYFTPQRDIMIGRSYRMKYTHLNDIIINNNNNKLPPDKWPLHIRIQKICVRTFILVK